MLSGSDPTPLAGDLVLVGGTLGVHGSQVLDPQEGADAVTVNGGTLTMDQSFVDDTRPNTLTNSSAGVVVGGGAATLTRSTFHGFGNSGVETNGGAARMTDDTFEGNSVGVTSLSGLATVARSTFQNELDSLQASGSGTVGAAGSVAQLIVVGTTPKLTAPRRVVVHVGKGSTVTVRGTGSPAPRLKIVKGKVPKGMKVTKKAGRLTISGRPKVASLGKRMLTVKATSPTGSATRTLRIVVRRA
jgi:hypothetical protein